jgi:hypothetical protein
VAKMLEKSADVKIVDVAIEARNTISVGADFLVEQNGRS